MERELLFSRRSFLQAGNAAVFCSLLANSLLGQPMKLREAKDAVDHLVLGVSNLQEGIEWFEKLTGVRPVVGGKHPNRGTQNALVSFSVGGDRQYLELLAPDPAQAGHPTHAELAKLITPRLILWASATNEIDVLVQQAKAAKLMVSGPMDGGRARPDGKMLKWRSLTVGREADKNVLYFNIVPFFINWDKDSPHPSLDSPTGCKLASLEFGHPEVAAMTELMKTIGLTAKITKADSPTITARLNTPKGKVVLK
jgi:catechol 2,3-dioxygenase-like lactoylglutathione lyase family enzyme